MNSASTKMSLSHRSISWRRIGLFSTLNWLSSLALATS
jgi:hypothetical protein